MFKFSGPGDSLKNLLFPKLPEVSKEVRKTLAASLLFPVAILASMLPLSPPVWTLFMPHLWLSVLFPALAALFTLDPSRPLRQTLRRALRSSTPREAYVGSVLYLVCCLRYLLLPAYAALLVCSAVYFPNLLPGLVLLPAATLSTMRMLRR